MDFATLTLSRVTSIGARTALFNNRVRLPFPFSSLRIVLGSDTILTRPGLLCVIFPTEMLLNAYAVRHRWRNDSGEIEESVVFLPCELCAQLYLRAVVKVCYQQHNVINPRAGDCDYAIFFRRRNLAEPIAELVVESCEISEEKLTLSVKDCPHKGPGR
jgi:hypothetical protein